MKKYRMMVPVDLLAMTYEGAINNSEDVSQVVLPQEFLSGTEPIIIVASKASPK